MGSQAISFGGETTDDAAFHRRESTEPDGGRWDSETVCAIPVKLSSQREDTVGFDGCSQLASILRAFASHLRTLMKSASRNAEQASDSRTAGQRQSGVPRAAGLTNRSLVLYSGHMKITASQFKARCLRLLDEVGRTGEELIILKRGRPVARVIPAGDAKPWLALRGRGEFVGDPTAPVISKSDIEALR